MGYFIVEEIEVIGANWDQYYGPGTDGIIVFFLWGELNST
jgi:hypothetical protein